MATTLNLQRVVVASKYYDIQTFPEAASQSFKAGQFVYLSGGKVTVCDSNATSILGMAMGDATGTTDKDCDVCMADENTTFEITISGASDPTFAATDAGVKMAMLVANNRSYADVDDTGVNDAFVVLALKRDGDTGQNIVGDDYCRGYVKVLETTFQGGTGGA